METLTVTGYFTGCSGNGQGVRGGETPSNPGRQRPGEARERNRGTTAGKNHLVATPAARESPRGRLELHGRSKPISCRNRAVRAHTVRSQGLRPNYLPLRK